MIGKGILGTPVIIKTKPKFLPKLRENLKRFEILPKSMPRFNMLSTFLTPKMMVNLAKLPFVEGIFLDREIRIPEIPYGSAIMDFSRFKARFELPRIRGLLTPRIGNINPSWISTIEAGEYLGADLAKQQGLTGIGMKIGVVDSDAGLRTTEHRQLRSRVTPKFVKVGAFVDTCGHGSFILTESIGGRVDFKTGSVEGIAPKASAVATKALLTPLGVGSTFSCLRGLENALDFGADVVNFSFGSIPIAEETDPLAIAVNQIPPEKIIVCSTGNEGGAILSPANHPNTLAVGSVNSRTNQLSSFSNRGPELDFIAPGEAIFSGVAHETLMDTTTKLSPGYTALDGTSMATPLIAGMVLLIKQFYKKDYGVNLTLDMVRDIGAKFGESKSNERGYGPLTFTMAEQYANTF